MGVVVKFLARSEKLEDIERNGKVQRVHPLLYKISIGVRGAFMAPNGNKVRTEYPM